MLWALCQAFELLAQLMKDFLSERCFSTINDFYGTKHKSKIHGDGLACIQCSWDELRIQNNPDQDTVLTEAEGINIIIKLFLLFCRHKGVSRKYFIFIGKQVQINREQSCNYLSKIWPRNLKTWVLGKCLYQLLELPIFSLFWDMFLWSNILYGNFN